MWGCWLILTFWSNSFAARVIPSSPGVRKSLKLQSLNQFFIGVNMKLSKIISQIALGETYNEKALLKCLSMKLILRNEYFDVIQRYLAGNTKPMDHILLQDISVCLHKIGS